MRFFPAALALSTALAVTASSGQGAPPAPLDPQAASLLAEGRAALIAGNPTAALDAFEAALAVQPGHVAIYLNLAEATRKQGLPGKALHYYRQAIKLEPGNVYAVAGEGETLAEKGAIEKAKRSLAMVQKLCGSCAPAKQLAAAIQKGPAPQVVTAKDVAAKPVVSEN